MDTFEIDPEHPFNRGMERLMRAVGGLAFIFGWALYFAGWEFYKAVGWSSFSLFVMTVAAWSWNRAFKGRIEVDETGIAMRRHGNEFLIRWDDIETVRLAGLGDTWMERSPLGWVLGMGEGDKVLRVRLKRMIRKHWFRERFSTRGFGIPSFTNDMVLAPMDPDSLFASINRRLAECQMGSIESEKAW